MQTDVNKEFGRLKAGYRPAPDKSKETGNLLLDGLPVEFNKPFAILAGLKKSKYSHITPRNRLKIVRN